MFWEDTKIDKTVTGGNSTDDTLVLGIPEDEIKGMTLTRLLMDLTIVAVTAGTGSIYAGGIFMAEGDAFAAAALPDPQEVGDDAGWVWRVAGIPVFNNDPNDRAQALRYVLDLRAQRKFIGEDYVLVIRNHNEGGASALNMNGFIRCLFKRA